MTPYQFSVWKRRRAREDNKREEDKSKITRLLELMPYYK